MFAVRAAAVRDESVLPLIEAQRILDPTDTDIASHLSLPHGESLEAGNALCPSRMSIAEMLYERHLSAVVQKMAAYRFDRYPIMILVDPWLEC